MYTPLISLGKVTGSVYSPLTLPLQTWSKDIIKNANFELHLLWLSEPFDINHTLPPKQALNREIIGCQRGYSFFLTTAFANGTAIAFY